MAACGFDPHANVIRFGLGQTLSPRTTVDDETRMGFSNGSRPQGAVIGRQQCKDRKRVHLSLHQPS
jgi:hypothetical protein